ncbi:MAG: aspartyl protease family protein [Bacteroidota bacterium]
MLKYTILLAIQITFTLLSAQSHDSGKIPFEMVRNTIILELTIEEIPYRFLLDTGGGFIISKELADRYDFPVVSEVEVGDVTRQTLQLNRVAVPAITLGNWTFRDRAAVVFPDWNTFPTSCFQLDGMIGRDFFTDAILDLDYQKRILRLTEDASVLELNEADATPLRINARGLPEALVSLNGEEQFVLFDSGSGDVYSPQTKRAKRMAKDQRLSFEGIFSFGLSQGKIKSEKRYRSFVSELKIGSGTLRNFHSQFSKLTSARMGAGILHYGRVTLDYQKQRFYCSPYEKEASPGRFTSFGADFTSLQGEYIIKWVMKGSPAEKAGLQYGQRVLQINDIVLSSRQDNCHYYLTGFGIDSLEELRLSILDGDGKRQEVSLRKQTN